MLIRRKMSYMTAGVWMARSHGQRSVYCKCAVSKLPQVGEPIPFHIMKIFKADQRKSASLVWITGDEIIDSRESLHASTTCITPVASSAK